MIAGAIQREQTLFSSALTTGALPPPLPPLRSAYSRTGKTCTEYSSLGVPAFSSYSSSEVGVSMFLDGVSMFLDGASMSCRCWLMWLATKEHLLVAGEVPVGLAEELVREFEFGFTLDGHQAGFPDVRSEEVEEARGTERDEEAGVIDVLECRRGRGDVVAEP